jgi:hypothetical protein
VKDKDILARDRWGSLDWWEMEDRGILAKQKIGGA